MNNKYRLFQTTCKQYKNVFILLYLDLLFLILAFIAAIFQLKYPNSFVIFFITIDILLIFSTILYFKKHVVMVTQDFPSSNNNGTNAFREDNAVKKIYETKGEPVLSPVAIAIERYTDIIINESVITIHGNHDMVADISIIIPNNRNCRLILDHVNLRGSDRPSIIIGSNSSVEIELIGFNLLNSGIRVPESSELTLCGEGDLTIQAEHTCRVGIGGNSEQSYGNITLASKGNITVIISDNISIGIGGGQNIAYSLIRLLSGNISVETTGSQSVGIGCISGYARIEINNCRLNMNMQATKAVNIGSIKGTVDIMTSGDLTIQSDSKYSIAIGVLEQGDGNISVLSGSININVIAHGGSGIGSISGKVNLNILGGEITIHGEGADMVGIGDQTGSGIIHIEGGIISVKLYAVYAVPIGNVERNVIIDGGNIQCDFPEDFILVNSHHIPLAVHLITNVDEFKQVIETVSYSYEYKANYSDRFPYIKVYLPENIVLQ